MSSSISLLIISLCILNAFSAINRHDVVSHFNPIRTASSLSTPMQIGNGNFAFGTDVTGLQTFQPFAIMSSWGWKNDSLPQGKTVQDLENYHGISWENHGRLVEYDFGGPDPEIEQWLISNPNRVNLGRIGLLFYGENGELQNVTESDLTDIHQELDLWTGIIISQFSWGGSSITVKTSSAQTSDSIGIDVQSSLLLSGRLGIFVDFPWNDGTAKFTAPFVGRWDAAAYHTTTLEVQHGGNIQASIAHTMDSSTFITSIGGDEFSVTQDSEETHRYSIIPQGKYSSFSMVATFTLSKPLSIPSAKEASASSSSMWAEYWSKGGFIDVATGSSDPRASELQRRIILSRYLMRVNGAGDTPPQESGLVNDGWYGKFHMEMFFWHSAHWALWNDWDLLRRSSTVYNRFLSSSIARAQIQQHWDSGARWPKMTDPSGRSAPGEINNLLIWQQVHPLIFATYEYRAFPTRKTLQAWETVVRETANWMADFAWWNQATGVYDLGPPMFVVSEDTGPNVTQNPAFELAYWRFGLGKARELMERLGREVPDNWTTVETHLAKLPFDNGTYMVYEGIESDFWTDPQYTNDHPSLVGLYGWLPQTGDMDLQVAKSTAEKVWQHWNISNCWGWDFPMLAMSAARNGEVEKAVEWLLHPLFQFDDVGMPVGGVRVPTPYFPGSGSLLYSVAMMASGWDGSLGGAPGFPKAGWNVRVEGVSKAL